MNSSPSFCRCFWWSAPAYLRGSRSVTLYSYHTYTQIALFKTLGPRPPPLYSPDCVEEEFCELRLARVLGTSHLLRSLTFVAVAFVVESHLAPIRQEQRHLPDRAYRRRQ